MCDTVVVIDDDAVRFAKNSDRDPNEAQLLDWGAAARHDADAAVRCTWIEVPQADHTAAILLSRPFWMWGAEIGANEHGVVVGNEAVWTNEPYAESGLTGMDLVRLSVERSTDRHDAVGIIVDHLERFGQGGGCGHEKRSFTYHNSFMVADGAGATVLETAGRSWATEEVRAGTARSISNALTIPEFAAAHADRLKSRVACAVTRRTATQSAASLATTTAQLAATLRLHHGGRAAPDWSVATGAMSSPCMHAGGLVASSQTTGSWLSELGANPRHWATGTAAPCTGIFKPVSVAEPIDTGPPPSDVTDPDSLWWRHERLHRRVMADPAALLPRYRDERDRMERSFLAGDVSSAEAFALADAALARWTADVVDGPHRDLRPRTVQRYWSVRDRRAGRTEGDHDG